MTLNAAQKEYLAEHPDATTADLVKLEGCLPPSITNLQWALKGSNLVVKGTFSAPKKGGKSTAIKGLQATYYALDEVKSVPTDE